MSYEPVSSPALLVPTSLPAGLSPQDASFLQQAFQANSLELVEGALAQAKGTNPATGEFANWMIGDHGGVAPTLVLLAQQLGVPLPSSFTPPQAAEFNTLSSLRGPAFDANYAVDQVAGHQQTLALFGREAASGQNAAVVAFAKQLIPALQAHLVGAEQLVGTTAGISLPLDTITPPTPLPSSGPALGTPSAQDAAFVQTAATANMAEVAQGQLAQQKPGNPVALQFANWMVADHSGAEASLQTLAGQEGLTLPSGLDQANQQELAQLQPLTDGAFFATYVTGQILAHTQSLTAFIQEAQYGQDPALKAYASTGISTLAGHLEGALVLEQSTPGALSAAAAVDQGLTSLLNAAAATGNATLFSSLRQIAALQPGFTYTPPATAAVGVAPLTPAVSMSIASMAHG